MTNDDRSSLQDEIKRFQEKRRRIEKSDSENEFDLDDEEDTKNENVYVPLKQRRRQQ
ncbi:unnamed protein product, partial [Adineta steineri]